ncbi:hypothetical protein DPMN_151737 [Dreissena polymorpha]|uniref:Uncharacterized protein n=1 Tax=Dreissena polymorpha TaxID=45954 RepID=A0A9D4FH28_DREPO|nr:hypothetical protein DPMN_151724 [Dreissena polymorpha]KAH3798147.1 hypothetical protein DPMN_151737 [Dreissena polymorpha]
MSVSRNYHQGVLVPLPAGGLEEDKRSRPKDHIHEAGYNIPLPPTDHDAALPSSQPY